MYVCTYMYVCTCMYVHVCMYMYVHVLHIICTYSVQSDFYGFDSFDEIFVWSIKNDKH